MFHHCKNLISVFLSIAVLFSSATMTFAEENSIDKALKSYLSEKKDEGKISKLKVYLNLVIDERLVKLESIRSQIPSDYRLLDVDKLVIKTLLDDSSTRLNNFKSQTESVQTLDEIKTIADEVYTNTRIYQVVLPKVYGWKTIARADYVIRESVINHLDKLKQAASYLKSQDVDTTELEKSLKQIEEESDEIEYRIKLVKETLDAMEAGRNLSEERSYIDGAKTEITKIKELLNDVQFEMKQVVNKLEPYF
jgi:hypothetical protein